MTPRGQRIFRRHQGGWLDPRAKIEAAPIQPDFAAEVVADATRLSELQLEVALYIESISTELRLMAKAANLEALSYFLEMARIEASIQIERRALSMST